MPSPLNGLTVPAASPTTRWVGPTLGPTEPPMGSRPLVGRPSRRVGVELPVAGRRGHVLAQEVGGVHALEVAERRQQPDADVHRAVADREDPAVARHRVAVAVLHVEARLDPRFRRERARPVPADGRAVGPLARSRIVPRARPKRELAPSATTTYRALTSSGAAGLLALDDGAAHEAPLDHRA